jgi:hypothetical protein
VFLAVAKGKMCVYSLWCRIQCLAERRLTLRLTKEVQHETLKQPGKSPAPATVETFGGDYYYFEHTFRPKSAAPPTAAVEDIKPPKPRKGRGKKSS